MAADRHQEPVPKRQTKDVSALLPFGLIAVFLLVGLMIVGFFVARYFQIKGFVSPIPMPIEQIAFSPEEQSRVKDRITGFLAADSTKTLVLNEREVNHLLQSSPTFRELDMKFRVQLEDTLARFRASAPAVKMLPRLKGIMDFLDLDGFVNAEMRTAIDYENGLLKLQPLEATMNGKDVPVLALSKKSSFELEKFLSAPGNRKLAEVLADVELVDGGLVLRQKPGIN